MPTTQQKPGDTDIPRTPPPVQVVEDTISSYDTVPFAVGGGGALEAGLRRAHTHYGVEIGTVLSGKGRMYLNGREFDMGPSDVYFVDASIPHWHYRVDNSELRHLWVCLPLNALINAWPARTDLRLYLPFVAQRRGMGPIVRKASALANGLREVHKLATTRTDDWDILAWQRIFWILATIHRAAKPVLDRLKDPLAPSTLLSVMPAVAHINDHFAEALSVPDLARRCNLSVSRFSHLFTEAMGISPIQYRNQLRINAAIEQLTGTTDTLGAIAEGCGFQSLSQFRDSFQRVTGTAPGAFRKQRQ